MKKFLVGLLLTPIIAMGVGFAPTASATDGSIPPSCDYQRWYPGFDLCGGYVWTISLAQECALDKTQCNPPKRVKPPKAKTWKVRKGDTLWHIAVVSYGPAAHAGQQYRQIMKRNRLRSTTIKVGQVLRLR